MKIPATDSISASDKHCIFRCQDSWFSVPAISVREVTLMTPLYQVPHCHQSLLGICHRRSEFIPVLSLHHLLHLDDVGFRSEGRSLLVLEGRTTWAVQIDEAAAITSLETIVAPDSRSDSSGTVPVRGTATFGDKIVRVLDPIGLYHAAQKSVHDFWKDADQQAPSTPRVTRENRE